MDDPYHSQARVPAAGQPGLGNHSQAAYTPYSHAGAPEDTEARQQRQYDQLQPQQGTAPGPPVLQGHPPVLQGHTARAQDVRVQCEAADCQALLQVSIPITQQLRSPVIVRCGGCQRLLEVDLAAALVHLAPYLQQQAASSGAASHGSAPAMHQVHQQAQWSPRHAISQGSHFHPPERHPYMPPSLSNLIPPPVQTQPLRPEPYRARLPPPLAQPPAQTHPAEAYCSLAGQHPHRPAPSAPQGGPHAWPPTPHSPQHQDPTQPEALSPGGSTLQQPFASDQTQLATQLHSDAALHQAYTAGQSHSQPQGIAVHQPQGPSMHQPYGAQHPMDQGQGNIPQADSQAPSLQQAELPSQGNPCLPRSFVVPQLAYGASELSQTQAQQATQWGEEHQSTRTPAVQQNYRTEGVHGHEAQPPQQPQSHRGPSVHRPQMTHHPSEGGGHDHLPSLLHSAPPSFSPPGGLPLGTSQPLSHPPDSSQYYHQPHAGVHSQPYGQDGPPQQLQTPAAYHTHASLPPQDPDTPTYTHPQYHAAAQVSAEQQQQQQQQQQRPRAQYLTQLAHEHGPRRSAGHAVTAPAGVSIAEYNSGGQCEDAVGPTRKRKKDKQRTPTVYNLFVRQEIARLKEKNPKMDHRTAFSHAADSWQYCPDNTGVAKRRRAKMASAAAVAASEPASEAHTPVFPSANDLPAHGQASAPELDQCQVQESMPGHWPAAESAGTSLGISKAGKQVRTETGRDASSAARPARKDETLVSDPQQVSSQLPSWLSLPLPAIQPAAPTLTELANVSDPAHLSDPAHVSDTSPRTCGDVEEVPPKPNPGRLQLPAQLQFSHEETFSHRTTQPAKQEPTKTSSDLPKDSSAAQEDTATPAHSVPLKLPPLTRSPYLSSANSTQGVQSGTEDVAEKTSFESAGMLCEEALHASACQATAAPTAAQEAVPLPETRGHHGRAVQEWSPEPRAANEGPRVVMGPERVVQALHDAFALYAKSRSRSQDTQQQQQQPRQLSVPNPFRVSPEALQRPALPSTHLPAAAQDSTQTPARNCPARATSRSMSPEALHVLQLGIADSQAATVHNNRCNESAAASHSNSPGAQLLAAPIPCRETLPKPTAAMDDTVPKTTAPAGWTPSPFFCEKQVDTEQKHTVHSSAEEVCSDSERRARAGQTWLSMSPSPVSDIVMMQSKLEKQHVQMADAHQRLEDVVGQGNSPVPLQSAKP